MPVNYLYCVCLFASPRWGQSQILVKVKNKREASGEPGGNTPQNKNRKGEKLDSEEDIDFTVICPAEQPQTMLPGGVKNEPSPWDRKREEERVIFEKKQHFMSLIDLHKKNSVKRKAWT